MKILITESQYFKLLFEEQLEMDFPNDIEVRYTNFATDTKFNRKFVYVSGVSKEDVNKIKELKSVDSGINVKFINVLTDETFEFSLDKINLTKLNSVPYIFIDEYDKIKGSLKTHDIKLDENFLKKSISGFPKFIIKTLFDLYPNNIGKNSFINGGVCESEDGLINIPGTNVPNQTWSILNYFDTNPMVIKKLIEWYMNGMFAGGDIPTNVSIESFETWITNNRVRLFTKGDRMDDLVKINFKSYVSGTKTENLTVSMLSEDPFNIDPKNIKQYCSGNNLDRWDSKDIEIITKSGVKYSQIKPLLWYKFNEETNEHVVKSYQMKNYKNKPLDYIIFTNSKKMLIFDNKNYKVEDNHFVIFKNPPLTNIE